MSASPDVGARLQVQRLMIVDLPAPCARRVRTERRACDRQREHGHVSRTAWHKEGWGGRRALQGAPTKAQTVPLGSAGAGSKLVLCAVGRKVRQAMTRGTARRMSRSFARSGAAGRADGPRAEEGQANTREGRACRLAGG